MAHNNYFQFKQFNVVQDHAAMRVGTDGVLLGAWANCSSAHHVLDIGTGTGLVALMLAQRSAIANIVGIDIDAGALSDATKNFQNSPWYNRLRAVLSPVQTFSAPLLFDLIVCNPPFFSNSLRASDASRNLARHTDSLPYADLFMSVAKMLSPQGSFCVVIPIEIESVFRMLAANHRLFARRVMRVRPNISKPIKRVLLEYAFEANLEEEKELIIEKERHLDYTEEFSNLLRDFYMQIG